MQSARLARSRHCEQVRQSLSGRGSFAWHHRKETKGGRLMFNHNGVESVKKNAPDAAIVDLTKA